MLEQLSLALVSSEMMIRLVAFVSVLTIMALFEAWAPRRQRAFPRATRWLTNLSFVGIGALIVRGLAAVGSLLAVPLVAVAAALAAERHGIGLFNAVAAPAPLAFLVSVIALDFAIWFQHFAAHRWQWLWVVHRVHHADRDFDVTTALRFHPIEIGLSMLWKVVWVVALGAPAAAVMVFEIILNALAMFNHANAALPPWLDRALRTVIVTPDMHRVHHSIHDDEHRANFGFNLSIWDRLFGTYTAQPRDGHTGMTIGLLDQQSDAPTRLGWSLRFPFTK
jgi:sterol desaturase/sphingolipid hydroxylase (fatty acid hydroxylase superfamily)